VSDPRDDDELAASPVEQAEAAAFGRRVADLLDGEPLAPAMAVDDRAMVIAAGQILASSNVVELDPVRQRRIIDRALALGLSARAGVEADSSASWPAPRRQAERAMRALPWAVASLAAAAAVILFVTRPADREARDPAAPPVELTSRPSDDLVGRIPRAEVAAATGRIDAIWSDRMAGYRALQLGGRR
jgi:hypothetical protein